MPYISGSDFTTIYSFVNFHFHWGYNQYEGSEHYINERKFPLEMHMVHQSKSGTIAVLAFLFEISATDDTSLDYLLMQIGNDSLINCEFIN